MDSERAIAVRTAHQTRPGKRAIVILDLADLNGPASGCVKLPIWLFWSHPGLAFDLSDRDMLRELYETVLREASRPEDLTSHLNRETLISVWPDIHLPRGVRQAWEQQHRELRDARTRAA